MPCSTIAAEIKEAANGKLHIGSFSDANVITALNSITADWKREPMLLMDTSGGMKIHRGAMLSLSLLRLLGLRSSRKILNLVAELQAEQATGSTARRRFLGFMGASALALGLGGIPLTAAAAMPQPTPEESAEIERELAGRPEVMEARLRIKAGGFMLDEGETVVITDNHDGYLAITFFPHIQDPENRAACLVHEYDGETRSTSVEFLRKSGDVIETDSAYVIPNSSIGRISSRGVKEYGGCIAMCVGANCANKARKCMVLRHMAAVLACMTAVCGSKVKMCHKICKNEW